MFAVDGKPVGKAMKESKSNLVHRFQPPIDKPTDNGIEKATKEILKDTLQYQPNNRPTMKQVMEQLSQIKKQIVTVGDFEVIVNSKHILWENKFLQTYGTVFAAAYLGQHITTQQLVTAVRYTTEAKNQMWVARFGHAYHMLRNVTQHKHIVKVYHCSKKEYEKNGKQMVEFWMILEHCQFGRLWDHAKEQELTIKQKLSLMIQTGRAICHLHEQQPVSVVHRNIYPTAVLVSGSSDAPVIKLANFYSATTVDKDNFPFSMQSYIGYDYSMAPEQTRQGDTAFSQLVYDISVDVFGLGISCLMLLEALKGSGMTKTEGKYNILYILFTCTFRYLLH